MDAYQELLNERNKLAAQVAAQAVEINALEQSTAVRIGKRLRRFAPLLHQALRVARLLRRIRNQVRRVKRIVTTPVTAQVGAADERSTIMVLVPEASATSRGLLALSLIRQLRASYRVVAVLLAGGESQAAFADAADIMLGPFSIGLDAFAAGLATAESLAATYRPRFAIAAGAETRPLATPLSTAGVPLIALIHEVPMVLASPSATTRGMLDRADDIVFSCQPVEDLYGPFYGMLDFRRTHVITPGQFSAQAIPTQRLRDRLAYIPADSFLVVGMGAIDYRSGVDVFIATASSWRSANPHAKFHFVWIGKAPDKDYLIYIDEQIARANVTESISMLYEQDDRYAVYGDCDAVYATARLDYLPSPAVDFALAGKPVISFDKAGGIAEILAGDSATAGLVLPHMDSTAAVRLLNDLAADRQRAQHLGNAARDRVRQVCDIAAYARQLIALGEGAARARSERPATRDILSQPGNFDAELYSGKPAPGPVGRIIDGYLERSYYDGFRKRGLAGFHPELYASQTPDFKQLRLDPLTHYLKAGRPAGPWIHRIIRLDKSGPYPAAQARVAIHGHFYYIDHVDVFLKALAANRTAADLFLTTGSEANRQHLAEATRRYHSGKVDIEIVPNKGRDIGPFLHLYRQKLHGAYDFIGHVHGKRSVHTAKWDPNLGERWRNFLFQHLIGPKTSAMDIVLQAFAKDQALGLVFPEDRNVIGWDFDFEHAQRLGDRMGFTITLPKYIDFPIGTMFWARSAALEPLLRLDIAWDDYPDEPLPVDGTILHALERLMPTIARQAGYDYATTYYPGIGY